MKILHTVPSLSVNAGGPSTCTYHLLKGLNELGVSADLLTFDSLSLIGNDDFIKRVKDDALSPLVYSRNIKKYLLYNKDYELYHANSIWTYPSHVTSVVAHENNKPLVLSLHGMLYSQALKVSAWKKKIILPLFQKRDLEQADCLHATCRQELQYIRNFGLKNPISIIPNCLNIATSLKNREEENSIKLFGFVGRIDRYKNIDVLLEAWKYLSINTKNAKLLIIGDGDLVYKKELLNFVYQNRMHNVSFVGFLRGRALEDTVRSLDFQVLPSKSENFGMVVPEALINRVPVIASKGTPWEELNTHHCGWWVDNTVNTLAQVMNEALGLPETIRIEMGERGRKLVFDKYTVEKVSLQMSSLYKWLLDGGNKPDFVYI